MSSGKRESAVVEKPNEHHRRVLFLTEALADVRRQAAVDRAEKLRRAFVEAPARDGGRHALDHEHDEPRKQAVTAHVADA